MINSSNIKTITGYRILCLLVWYIFSVLAQAAPPLAVDDAFDMKVSIQGANSVGVQFRIAAAYYLYDDIDFQGEGEALTLGNWRGPKPVEKNFPGLGIQGVYQQDVTIVLPVLAHQAGEYLLQIHYQGCSSYGYCYPPVTRRILLRFNTDLVLEKAKIEPRILDIVSSGDLMDQTNILQWLGSSTLGTIALFLILGILMSLTPCVLPMVPILSSIISTEAHLNTKRGFLLALVYVLAMALTYAAVGFSIGYFGAHLQIWFQQTWVVQGISLIFLLLGMAMFGLFTIRMPIGLSQRLSSLLQHLGGGKFWGVALMGVLATLVVTPCVTPPLVGAISYIGFTGDYILGGASLFAMGLGMGLPLLVIGTSLGRWMPKQGQWMEWINVIIGAMLMSVAIALASRTFNDTLSLLLWGTLLVFLSYCVFYRMRIHAGFTSRVVLWCVSVGIMFVVGLLMQSELAFRPMFGEGDTAHTTATYARVETVTALEKQIQQAQEADLPMFLDFYADWCAYCKTFHHDILTDPDVKQALENWAVVIVDVTDSEGAALKLMRRYQVVAPPTLIFLDNLGKEISNSRLTGSVSKRAFLDSLRRLQSHMKKP